jgi:nicotinamide riboside transporter PnuC
MNWADILASVLTVVALFLMISKNRACFVLFTIGNILFIYVSITKSMWGLMGMNFIYMGFNTYGFIAWGRSDDSVSGNGD